MFIRFYQLPMEDDDAHSNMAFIKNGITKGAGILTEFFARSLT